jgi:hypothetical protein
MNAISAADIIPIFNQTNEVRRRAFVDLPFSRDNSTVLRSAIAAKLLNSQPMRWALGP